MRPSSAATRASNAASSSTWKGAGCSRRTSRAQNARSYRQPASRPAAATASGNRPASSGHAGWSWSEARSASSASCGRFSNPAARVSRRVATAAPVSPASAWQQARLYRAKAWKGTPMAVARA